MTEGDKRFSVKDPLIVEDAHTFRLTEQGSALRKYVRMRTQILNHQDPDINCAMVPTYLKTLTENSREISRQFWDIPRGMHFKSYVRCMETAFDISGFPISNINDHYLEPGIEQTIQKPPTP